MTIAFISGPHCSGKTTLINNVKTDRPEVKVTNLDMSEKVLHTNPSVANQFIRHMEYFTMMKHLVKLAPDKVILVDRAPYSLNIYDRVFYEQGIFNREGYKALRNHYDICLAQLYANLERSKHKVITLYLDIPKGVILHNIKARDRGAILKENDVNYLDAIINRYKLFKSSFVDHTSPWDATKDAVTNYKLIDVWADKIIRESMQ